VDEAQVAAEALRDAQAEREAETCALSRRLGGEEGVEDARSQVWRDAGAVVLEAQAQVCFVEVCADVDGGLWGLSEGVGGVEEQVEQDLDEV
jgi:hypothetical protein